MKYKTAVEYLIGIGTLYNYTSLKSKRQGIYILQNKRVPIIGRIICSFVTIVGHYKYKRALKLVYLKNK